MASSLRNLLPRSFSSKHKPFSNPKSPKSDAENTPPTDPNIQISSHDQALPKQSHPKTPISPNNKLTQSEPPPQSDPSVKASFNFFAFFGLIFLELKF